MFTTKYFSGDLPARHADVRGTLRTVLGAVRYPMQTLRWARFLHAHPLLAELADAEPGIIAKIHRPYHSTGLSCVQRVDLLMQHYQILLEAGLGNLVRQGTVRPIPVCSFVGKSKAVYRVELSTLDAKNQAGELELRLLAADRSLYAVSFLLTMADGHCQIRVGRLNGTLANGAGIGIKQVTRDLYGCRPKELMIALVREAGGLLGCTRTLLVGNGNKLPPTEKRYCRKSADYDRTWKDMDAMSRADGDFELPCTVVTAGASSTVMRTRRSALMESARLSLRDRLAAEQAAAAFRLATSPGLLLRQK